jgi:hypothetical protein
MLSELEIEELYQKAIKNKLVRRHQFFCEVCQKNLNLTSFKIHYRSKNHNEKMSPQKISG